MSNPSPEQLCVLGCAISGVAAARLAVSRGCQVTILDEGDNPALQQRAAELRAEGIRVVLGPEALAEPTNFTLGVLSPGLDPSWALPQSLLRRNIPVIGEIEFAWSFNTQDVIAITGTNGKTTTTELIERLLLANGLSTVAGGNYGLAFSQIILDATPVDVHTLEVSSFQLETIVHFRPKIALWLNFAADHLDRHPSMEAYRAAKLRIFENQTAADFAVVNAMEPLPELAAQVISFSAYTADGDFFLRDGSICFRGEPVLALSALKLRGLHNVENVMAALAVGYAMGISFAAMQAPLAAYEPAPHRCELVGAVAGREFINDSKATNVHATQSALRGMSSPVVLILGGKDKGLDYEPLRASLPAMAAHVVTFGEIAASLAAALQGAAPISQCETLAEAVREAFARSAPGQIILFSPATSSFDQFRSYAHRGDTFRELVAHLAQSNPQQSHE
jgi:UDP-N-acetylmuramoylalanine--D-glutamate ligase